MQFIAEKINIGQDFNEGAYTVTFYTKQSPMRLYEELQNIKQIDVEAKKYRKKRSLNANSYFWELTTQLANILRTDKEELYFLLLQRYGQSEMVSVLAVIDVSNYFKYYKEAGESILNGKNFKHYKVYKGSSEMDSKEMSILIDGLVSECKEVGIETKSKAEIDSLLKEWDKK